MEFIKKYKYIALAAVAAAALIVLIIILGTGGEDSGENVSGGVSSEVSDVASDSLSESVPASTPAPESKPESSIESTGESSTENPADSSNENPESTEHVDVTAPATQATATETTSPPQTTPAPSVTESTAETTKAPVTSTTPKPVTTVTTSTPQKEYNSLCTLTIDCRTLLDNMDRLDKNKHSLVPSDGMIFSSAVGFDNGENAFEILRRVCNENGIHLEASYTPAFGSSYIEGINNLYEFDCGSTSGWIYKVNGETYGTGASSYKPKNGDKIEFVYTCELGFDVGAGI
ncbi:MAG: DUF4430 domain-containing protein [Eubacterium sp.]|nr:DUF4430 domain-containing protein [Eubacterium sp.]